MFPFSDKVYQYLKWIAMVLGPALTALVGVIGTAIGWADVGVCVTILAGVVTFIGALVGVSTVSYNKNKE